MERKRMKEDVSQLSVGRPSKRPKLVDDEGLHLPVKAEKHQTCRGYAVSQKNARI